MITYPTRPLEELYAEPSRNGINRPRRTRGAGFKMVNMGELFSYDRIADQEMERVPLTEDEQRRYGLTPGDLLFARQSLVAEGTGKCSIVLRVPQATVFESHLIRVRLDHEEASPLFYYYYFKSPQGKANVQSLVMQVAAAGIRGSELSRLRVPHPPKCTQRKIAAILGAYDDLIENSTRRIAIIEEVLHTIFREWFVEFRFPGSAAIPMVDSDRGPIPRGWQIVPFSAATGIDPKTIVPKAPHPFVPMSGLSADSMVIGDIETRTSTSGAKFRNCDTLLARITPSIEHGKTGFVQFLPSESDVATGSTEFIVLRSRTLNPYFVYCFARFDDLRQHAIKSMSGASGRQRVQKQCFDNYLFAHPDQATLDNFERVVEPMFREVHVLWSSIHTLRRTRDFLLPRLVSGEVDVTALEISTSETVEP